MAAILMDDDGHLSSVGKADMPGDFHYMRRHSHAAGSFDSQPH